MTRFGQTGERRMGGFGFWDGFGIVFCGLCCFFLVLVDVFFWGGWWLGGYKKEMFCFA